MWGSLPEWISALGAIGALTAAIWAALTSKKLFQIESGRDERAAERTAREQASHISAWCVAEVNTKQKGILLHNSSTSPVYNVEVYSTYAASNAGSPEPQKPFQMGILPPGDFISIASSAPYVWEFPDSTETRDEPVRPVTRNKAWAVNAIRFTDAHGLGWERSGGLLRRMF